MPVETAAPAPPATDTLRPKLKAAIKAFAVARENLDTAQRLSNSADAALEAAKNEHLASHSVQFQVRNWKIEALKSGSNERMPENLQEGRREALLASQTLEDAKGVAEHLAAELRLHQDAVGTTEQAVYDAANAIVMAEAARTVAEINQLAQRRKYLREVLRGVTLMRGTPAQHREFGALVSPVMQNVGEPELAYPKTAPGASRYWDSFSTALLNNPDAPVPALPEARDLWT